MNIIAIQRWGIQPNGDSNEVGWQQIPMLERDWWWRPAGVVGSLNAGKSVGEVLANLSANAVVGEGSTHTRCYMCVCPYPGLITHLAFVLRSMPGLV